MTGRPPGSALVGAPAGRRARGTWTCIAVMAAGVIVRFAGGTDSGHILDVHAAGVAVIGAGELGLLPLLVWGPLNPAWRHHESRPAPPDAAPGPSAPGRFRGC